MLTADVGTPTPGVGRAFTWKNKPEEYLAAIRADSSRISLGLQQPSRDPSPSADGSRERNAVEQLEREKEKEMNKIAADVRQDVIPNLPSAVASVADETDFQGPLLDADRKDDSPMLELMRRHSMDATVARLTLRINEDRWPRRMSFGDAEEAVLTWDGIVDIEDASDDPQHINALSEVARHMFENIAYLSTKLSPWVTTKLTDLTAIHTHFTAAHAEIEETHTQLDEACQRVRHNSAAILSDEKAALGEAVREIEALVARLEYEVDALEAKVRDVEDGAQGFERQVEEVEKRAEALKQQIETESWVHWLVRSVTGIGMGPNITRARE